MRTGGLGDRRRVVRFVTAGAVSFALDFGGLILLHSGLGWQLGWAVLVAYGSGGAVHYLLTRLWVFNPAGRGSETGRFLRYLSLGGLNIAATWAVVLSLTRLGVDYRLAKILCVAALVVFNYVVTHLFVMRSAPGGLPPL